MSKELSSKYYNKVYNKKTNSYILDYKNSPHISFWNKSLNYIKEVDNPKVLDIGCGPGQYSQLLFDNNNKNYTGIDFSQTAINQAKERNDKSYNFKQIDLNSIDNLNQFDYNIVTMFEVLEHIEKDIRIIKMIKPNTLVLFSVPSFMTKGHVRAFKSSKEVENRYSDYFKGLEITEYKNLSKNPNNWIFFCKGTKR